MPAPNVAAPRNPPIEYAVAVWLGMPAEEIARGLREGWIRKVGSPPSTTEGQPAQPAAPIPPSPEDATTPPAEGAPAADDRTRIAAVLHRLDRTMSADAFDRAWSAAGEDDAARAARFVGFLSSSLGVRNGPQAHEGGGTGTLTAIESAAAGASGTARFVVLDEMTTRDVEALARSDGGVRRALAQHAPWALAGDRELARRADPGGRFDRFDVDSGETLLSDAWIDDRARHAAWLRTEEADGARDVPGASWRFVDRAMGDAATVELSGAEANVVHQVIFARDDGDRVDGDAGTDRMHGGEGDDVLRGRAGDDLLEGGAGSDMLLGGSGRDDLAGQQGDDDLDGGAGDDRLDGGSGNDELAGGSGNDLLRGGAGVDVYRVDSGGGRDTIVDDGGVIVFDDVVVAGTMARADEGWISADGRLRFSLEGDDRATLVIRAASDEGGLEANAIRIAGWSPGGFGISLAASEGESTPPVDENPHGEGDPAHEDEVAETSPGLAPGDSGDAHDGGDTDDAGSAPLAVGRFGRPLDALSFDPATLVDAQAFAAAWEAWSPPSPPGTAAEFAGDVAGVSAADVADALSDSGEAGETEGVSSLGEGAWSLLSPSAIDAMPLQAPQPLLRRAP